MSNTVPELRADKNGKLVTRHVKQSPAVRWAKTLPQQPKQDVQALRDVIVSAMNVYGIRREVDRVAEENLPVMARLVTSFDYSTMDGDVLAMERRLTPEQFKKCALVLEAHQKLAVAHLKAGNYSDGVGDMIALVTGTLRHRFRMNKEQRAVLIEGVCRVWSDDAMEDLDYLNVVFPKRGASSNSVAFNDATIRDDLAKLIVDNPDKLDMIVDCLGSRKISDAAAITEVIGNSAAKSLSAGAL